ncbi:uncharacterized protein DNG_03485 [Cephalotrichum gorgonifer]|uniref:Uncharacterized protein n=1 Tax=Cephalotrichum gorgonifer TaxID=2041049 RepID=A0AAE8MWC5_9PEZI|nr:uncharacterized protein DNG_03485 [Cephalotrichum gorgonifer]
MGCSPCNNCDDRRCQSYHSSDETTFVPDDISLTRLKLDDDALPIAPVTTIQPTQSDSRPDPRLKSGPLSPSQVSSREPHTTMPSVQPIQPPSGPDTLDPDSFRPGVPLSQEPQPQTPKIHPDNARGPTPPPKIELLRSGQGSSWEPRSHAPNIQPESPRAGQWQSWEQHPYIPRAQHDSEPGSMVKPDTLLPGQWSSWEPHPHMPRVTWICRELPDGSREYLLHYADLGETRRFRDGEMTNLERVDWPKVEYRSTRRLHPAPSRAHSIASPVARSDSSGETEIGEASEWGHRQGHNQEYYQGHSLGHRRGYDQEYHHHHQGHHHRGIPNAEYLGLGISSDRAMFEQEIRRQIRLEKEREREEKKKEREEKKRRRSGKRQMCFVAKKGRPVVVQSLRR